MNYVIAGLVVVIGVLGGFYGGAKYGQAHPTSAAAASSPSPAQDGGFNRSRVGGVGAQGGQAGGGAGFAPAASGQIVAVGNGTITVHDRQTNKDVKVNVGSARISKTVPGTASDLTQNEAVTVSGQAGADGVVNAQAIAIGGAGAFGGAAGGRGRPSPSP